jgi:hypothetical protein
MFIGVNHTVALRGRRVEKTFRAREHLVIDNGPYKLSRPCSAEQGVQVDVAHPPEDKWVGFLAILGPSKEGDVKEAGDMVRPEVRAVRLGGCNLRDVSIDCGKLKLGHLTS